jgi:hypothetical protein
LAGAIEQRLVAATVWQLRPGAHGVEQPPQFFTSLEMSTHLPAQQRFEYCVPHWKPSG